MADTYTSRTLRELVRIVASRFLGMVLIFIIIVGAVIAASFYAPKWYRSEVQLMAQPTSVGNPLAKETASLRERVSLFVTTQREIILSETVLGAALMMLDDSSLATPSAPVKDKGFLLSPKLEKNLPAFISEHTDDIRKLKDRVTVVTPGGPDATFTQTFKITVDWPEIRKEENGQTREERREKAADDCRELANYLVQAYLARSQQIETKRTAAASAFLKGKTMEEARRRVEDAESALGTEAEELGADLLPIASIIGNQGIDSGAAKNVTELESSISTVEARLAELTALKAAVTEQLTVARKDPSMMAVPDEITSDNSVVRNLQEQITDLELKLNSLTPKYTKSYQEVDTTRKELNEAYNDLRKEMIKQEQRLAMSLRIKQAQRDNLRSRLAKFTADMKRIGPQAIRYNRLKEAAKAAKDYYEEQEKEYLASLQAASLAKNPILVSVVDSASQPDPNRPRRPILWLNILIACVGGLILALVYAFLADHFDHTIKSVDDAERYLGAPVVASVPKIGRRIIQTR